MAHPLVYKQIILFDSICGKFEIKGSSYANSKMINDLYKLKYFLSVGIKQE